MPLNFKDYNDLYEPAQLVERDLSELTATTFRQGLIIKPLIFLWP